MTSILRPGSQQATMHNRPTPESLEEERVHTTADMYVVNDRILSQMVLAGYPERDLFSMRLALEEAVVNAIKHGNGSDPGKPVRISYRVTAEQIFVEIEDQGPGFDPDTIPDPLAPENLELPSGRGLFLIRYYMTFVKFNDRGNSITMWKDKSR